MRTCVLSVLLLVAGSALAGRDPAVRLTTSDSAAHNVMTPARSIAAGPTGHFYRPAGGAELDL
jgi:hypothetical protein